MDSGAQLSASNIKEALACGLIGMVVSACVYGITILQGYIYFRNSSKDSMRMRYFVVFLFVLDTVSLGLAVSAFYQYFVIDFGDPSLLLSMPRALAFENGVTVLIRTLTQWFFAHRIWALSKGNMGLASIIAILALCSLGPAMVVSAHLYTDRSILSTGSLEIRILAGFATGLSAICDIAIVIALCYYLHSKRTGFRRTDSIIDRLIIYAVNRGVLTAICQVCVMITTVALPDHFVFLPFTVLVARLYCNTLLATLNAQKSMRQDESDNVVELGTHLLDRINRRAAGNRNRHSIAQMEIASDSVPTFVIDISGKVTGMEPTTKAGHGA